MSKRLPERVRAVVTGAASGLGRAFAYALAERGGRLVLGDVDLEGCEQTAAEVRLRGGEAAVLRCDVAELAQVEALATEAEQRYGGADLVVNNAGVGVAGPLGEIPMQDWQWILGINLWGVIYGCHVFVPRFKAQGHGAVLNVASAAGLLCAPEMAPYNVTKAGVVALSETMAAELAPHNIAVTVLCPTFFPTNILDRGRHSGAKGEKLARKLMAQSRFSADDIARIALEGLEAGTLYVVPQQDGQWLWRLKRLAPQQFYTRVLSKGQGLLARVRR